MMPLVKRIGIRHVRMHRFNDTAISRAHRPYTVGISFEPVLYLDERKPATVNTAMP